MDKDVSYVIAIVKKLQKRWECWYIYDRYAYKGSAKLTKTFDLLLHVFKYAQLYRMM